MAKAARDMAKTRGFRGATTADDNTKEAIVEATKEMLEALVAANDIEVDDIASATFSTTRDLNAEFPAVAARKHLGWNYVALMNSHEMDVPDAQPNCIRVMVLVNTDKEAETAWSGRNGRHGPRRVDTGLKNCHSESADEESERGHGGNRSANHQILHFTQYDRANRNRNTNSDGG